ncbi:MAG: glycosyltransferase [Nitrososphaerota archaeon]
MSEYVVIDPSERTFTGSRINLSAPPRVSFVIPTLNNEKTIGACLESIRHQDYPEIEVIVVDGYSKDKTVEIANRYADIVLFDKGTYGSACKLGFENATGEIVGMFDADIIFPHPNWLRNAVKYFNYNDRVSTVEPFNIVPKNASIFAKAYSALSLELILERIRTGRGVLGGGNCLLWKDAVVKSGGIDGRLHWGADFTWAKNLKESGYMVVYTSDPVYHITMSTLREFLRKQIYGARTFTGLGFDLMGLNKTELVYEHIIVGVRGFRKLFLNREWIWVIYPLLLIARIFTYSLVSLTFKIILGESL